MANNEPENPTGSSEQTSPPKEAIDQPKPSSDSVPSTGNRPALRNLGKHLTDEELGTSGVQKLLLDMIREADNKCEDLKPYVNKFHVADKDSAILKEKIKTKKANEIFFGVGVSLGGAIIGLTPYFYTIKPGHGLITGIIGVALVAGATFGRMVSK